MRLKITVQAVKIYSQIFRCSIPFVGCNYKVVEDSVKNTTLNM